MSEQRWPEVEFARFENGAMDWLETGFERRSAAAAIASGERVEFCRYVPILSQEQRERLRLDFFAVIDGRIRQRQLEVEPPEPARLSVADVHAAIDSLLRDLAGGEGR